jgi:HEAT repeat protein
MYIHLRAYSAAVEPLAIVLKDENESVRKAVANALAKIGNEQAMHSLDSAFDDAISNSVRGNDSQGNLDMLSVLYYAIKEIDPASAKRKLTVVRRKVDKEVDNTRNKAIREAQSESSIRALASGIYQASFSVENATPNWEDAMDNARRNIQRETLVYSPSRHQYDLLCRLSNLLSGLV